MPDCGIKNVIGLLNLNLCETRNLAREFSKWNQVLPSGGGWVRTRVVRDTWLKTKDVVELNWTVHHHRNPNSPLLSPIHPQNPPIPPSSQSPIHPIHHHRTGCSRTFAVGRGDSQRNYLWWLYSARLLATSRLTSKGAAQLCQLGWNLEAIARPGDKCSEPWRVYDVVLPKCQTIVLNHIVAHEEKERDNTFWIWQEQCRLK